MLCLIATHGQAASNRYILDMTALQVGWAQQLISREHEIVHLYHLYL